jgi:hypothetical protein
MPKRVLDFDAMWGSDKLAACAAWAQAEYAWLYGLADASGCFELTNLRVIWGRVAAIRGNFTIERLEQVFAEFQDKGLLFVWEHEGKRYAHWTGSDVPGRLPPPSWRMRLERFAPPVPKQQLAEYMAKFARGRAALAGVGFRGEAQEESSLRKENCKFENSDLKVGQDRGGRAQSSQSIEQPKLFADREDDCRFEMSDLKEERGRGERAQCGQLQLTEERLLATDRGENRGDQNFNGMGHPCRDAAAGSGLKGRLEEGQAQDLDLGWNLNEKWAVEREGGRGGPGDARVCPESANREPGINRTDFCNSNSHSNSNAQLDENSNANSGVGSKRSAASFAWREKDLALARELRVGQGPVCGPGRVRPEVLERIRKREAARAGSRSP